MLGRLDVDHGAVSRRLELHFQRLELKDRFMFFFILLACHWPVWNYLFLMAIFEEVKWYFLKQASVVPVFLD